MKKTVLLMACVIVLLVSYLILIKKTENKTDPQKEYLKKVLSNLEQIKSATYNTNIKSYMPWDTSPSVDRDGYSIEYSNPADTFLGSSFVYFNMKDSLRVSLCYDGKMSAYIFDEHKGVLIDSFKVIKHKGYRVINAPFFTWNECLIKYVLETNDSLIIKSKDYEDHVQFSFTIYDDVVEVIGNRIVHDTMHLSAKGKISQYDIWIHKSNGLPYKSKRDMPHNMTIRTIENVELNTLDISNFVASDFFPRGYTIKEEKASSKTKKSSLEGTVAADWTLTDSDNNTVKLSDLKTKVLVVQFTGIGCGACQAAIPFLKQLVIDYQAKDFEFVSLESWGSKVEALKRYKNHHGLNYKFLKSPKNITAKYNVGAVPVIFILDEKRTIKKVIQGYGKGTTDKKILDAIDELI